MQHHLSKILASGLLAWGACATAVAAPVITQQASVNATLFPTQTFVAGSKTSNPSASATDGQLYWYDQASGQAGGALGGGASLSVSSVSKVRAMTDTGSTDPALARLTLASSQLAKTTWSIDLGSAVLVSNVQDYEVVGSSISVVDFGNVGSTAAAWFNFSIGLWDGAHMVLASGLDQLDFGIVANGAGGAGAVTYLGNSLFRFNETGSGSGTTLTVSSALDGYAVRGLAASGFGVTSGTSFSGDYVDLTAGRTLQALTADKGVAEVPEPSALALMATGLLALAWRRRRAAAPAKR